MRCSISIFLFIFQFLVLNKCFCYEATEAEEFEYSNTPVARSSRSIRFDQFMFSKRDVIERLLSYFRWPSSLYEETNNPVILADGVGEVFVQGDDICTNGVTEVEGAVPISGSVVFSGPVKASGTITIAGKCAPASRSSPLRIGQPIQLTPKLLPPSPPEVTAAVSPTSEFIPQIPEILPKIKPDPVPTIILPPVVIPAIVIPSYVLPEVVIPSDLYELGTGKGNLLVAGNDVLVNGNAVVDGSVPVLGEVTFSGNVAAKGSVTICATF